MHGAVFNGGSMNDKGCGARRDGEMEKRKWTHSCGFFAPSAGIFDNFDPTSFKWTNISTKSEIVEVQRSEKIAGYIRQKEGRETKS